MCCSEVAEASLRSWVPWRVRVVRHTGGAPSAHSLAISVKKKAQQALFLQISVQKCLPTPPKETTCIGATSAHPSSQGGKTYIYIRLLETASKLILNAFVLAFKSLLAFEYEQINMVFDIRRVKTSHWEMSRWRFEVNQILTLHQKTLMHSTWFLLISNIPQPFILPNNIKMRKVIYKMLRHKASYRVWILKH